MSILSSIIAFIHRNHDIIVTTVVMKTSSSLPLYRFNLQLLFYLLWLIKYLSVCLSVCLSICLSSGNRDCVIKLLEINFVPLLLLLFVMLFREIRTTISFSYDSVSAVISHLKDRLRVYFYFIYIGRNFVPYQCQLIFAAIL